MIHQVVGPPGTGKTTFCINLVEEALAAGIAPERIGYFSFTTRAAHEAVSRACAKFGRRPKEFPYFRTLHSLAFRENGLQPNEIMQQRNYVELGVLLGLDISGQLQTPDEGFFSGHTNGDRTMFHENLSRVKMMTIEDYFNTIPQEDRMVKSRLVQFQQTLLQYKKDRGLVDYTDMLTMFLSRPVTMDFDLLIVDEAQDLSRLQWEMVKKLMSVSKNTYIAGDDDQAIYRWAGADVDRFVDLPCDERIVLDHSYRIPRAVHACAERISARISKRIPKVFSPKDEEGMVKRISSLDSLDMSKGTWLILARTGFSLLFHVRPYLERRGLYCEYRNNDSSLEKFIHAAHLWCSTTPETRNSLSEVERDILRKYMSKSTTMSEDRPWWEALDKLTDRQRNKLLQMWNNGEDLSKRPRIRCFTIHSSKGAEADNVVLFSDTSKHCQFRGKQFLEDENRVFYVGATRAKQNLYIVEPHGNFFYEI